MKLSHVPILLIIILPNIIWAQDRNAYGLLPSVNVNSKLPKDWFSNFKIESRQEAYNDDFEYLYKLTEVSLGAGTKIGLRTKAAFGYQLGFNSKEIFNRFIQQISYVKKYRTFSLAQRLQTDQTIFKNNNTEYRIRYRITTEIPLNGQKLDAKELFVKINNEYLNSIQSEEYDLEIRVASYIGYALSPRTKLEIGLDNRIDSFINDQLRNRLWLGINLYHSIN